MADPKPNFSPPGWLVTRFDVRLDEATAKELDELRRRLCAPLDPQDHTGHEDVHVDALVGRAIHEFVGRCRGKVLFDRTYHGFESLNDYFCDVHEAVDADLNPAMKDVPGEFTGKVRVTVTYEEDEGETT